MKFEPDENGYWGGYGGRFVPETLVSPLDELTTAYLASAAPHRCISQSA
jgi:tryptophan synthase beta chain